MSYFGIVFVKYVNVEQTFQHGQGQFSRKKNFTNEVDTNNVVVPHLKETEEERLRKQEAGT